MKILGMLFLSIIVVTHVNAQTNFQHQVSQEDQFLKTKDPFTSIEIMLENPCKDEMYLKLKKMDINEMSDREYEIFKQKDKACNEYLNTKEETTAEKKNAESIERATNAYTTVWVISGIVSVASLIYLFTI